MYICLAEGTFISWIVFCSFCNSGGRFQPFVFIRHAYSKSMDFVCSKKMRKNETLRECAETVGEFRKIADSNPPLHRGNLPPPPPPGLGKAWEGAGPALGTGRVTGGQGETVVGPRNGAAGWAPRAEAIWAQPPAGEGADAGESDGGGSAGCPNPPSPRLGKGLGR